MRVSQMAAGATVWFAFVFGALMWIFSWSKQGWTGVSAVAAACAAGTPWGVGMAHY
jgi:hypothetical protein